jgi:AcrR family transcriptional regulator
MGDRSGTPEPPRTAPLTRAEIARAAVDLVDRDGVARFSMRHLADALGVSTMAVYHHFQNKAEVLQAAADQVWIDAALAVVRHDDPVEDLVQAMLAVRRTFRDHAEVTPFAFASPTTEEAVHVSALAIVDRFERIGFRGEQVAFAYQVIGTYALGSAVIHAERTIIDRAIRQPVSDLADFAPEPTTAEAVAATNGVAYRSVREVLLGDPDLVHFERGLRDILAGLTARYLDQT